MYNTSVNKQIQDKLTQLFETGTAKTFSKGEVLVQAGQEPEGVSLIVSGTVEQYDITTAGNKVTVNMFRPPAFFPMSWAMNRTPNTFFFAALTNVELKQIDAKTATDFLRAHPDVMYDLLSRVYKGTDALLRRLVLTASGVATARLVFELLLEAHRFGTQLENGQTQITVRQSLLADRSGLARETISREMHRLEEDGLIKRTKQGIALDLAALEQRLDLAL